VGPSLLEIAVAAEVWLSLSTMIVIIAGAFPYEKFSAQMI